MILFDIKINYIGYRVINLYAGTFIDQTKPKFKHYIAKLGLFNSVCDKPDGALIVKILS